MRIWMAKLHGICWNYPANLTASSTLVQTPHLPADVGRWHEAWKAPRVERDWSSTPDQRGVSTRTCWAVPPSPCNDFFIAQPPPPPPLLFGGQQINTLSETTADHPTYAHPHPTSCNDAGQGVNITQDAMTPWPQRSDTPLASRRWEGLPTVHCVNIVRWKEQIQNTEEKPTWTLSHF